MELDLSFDDLDLNNDGKLDKHEIKIIMTMLLGKEPDDVLLDEIIGIADVDGDGYIYRDELDAIYDRIKSSK